MSESGILMQAFHALAHNKIQILEPRHWVKDRIGRVMPPPFTSEGLNGVAWRQNTGVAIYGKQKVRFGIPGQADIAGLLKNGISFGLECKFGKGKASPIQNWYHAFFRDFGMRVASVMDYEQADAAIKYWLAGGAA